MSDYFDRVERQIVRKVEAGLPRSSRLPAALGYLAWAAAVLIVVVVAGVFLLTRGTSNMTAPSGSPGVTVTFKASAIDPRTHLEPALDRSLAILRERLRSAFPGSQVIRAGNDVVVVAPKAGGGARARILALAVPGQLAFYDWEADAITPNGKTVASQLQAQDPLALNISQGSGSAAPGDPGAGAMSLHQATVLFSKLSAPGFESRVDQLGAPLPSEGFQPGARARYVVLEAVNPRAYRPANFGDPSARFYVLKDVPFLTGLGITHPRQGTDSTGRPDIEFGFTPAADFEGITRRIAQRGDRVSSAGQTLNQHFAVALDGRLITVPYIDFRQYPDGITGDSSADLAAGFTVQSARDLATILRYGPLHVILTATG